MILKNIFGLSFIIILLNLHVKVTAQNLIAADLIEKSIAFHDPNNQWHTFKDTLHLKQETPNETIRFRTVYLENTKKYFEFHGQYENGMLKYLVTDNVGIGMWNDSKIIPEEIIKKYKISPDRALMYRNYYSYLYGMPMKLKDPGTIVHPKVESVEFHGKEYYKIKITYIPEVGKDTWFFYFDKVNYALGAYEFYHKEPTDGEYLLLEGIKIINQVKLPENISWFMTKDDKFLGKDILE